MIFMQKSFFLSNYANFQEFWAGNRRKILGWTLVLSILLGSFFIWKYSPLADWSDPEMIESKLESFRDSYILPLVFLVLYLFAGLFLFPLTVLNAAGVLLLGPWQGFQYAFLGNMSSALFSYLLFYYLGRRILYNFTPMAIKNLNRKFSKNGLLNMIILRNFPVSFGFVSIMAAAAQFRFKEYFWGTLLGMLPGLIFICFMAEGLRQIVYSPDTKLFLIVLLLGIAAFLICKRVKYVIQNKIVLDLDEDSRAAAQPENKKL